MSLCHAEEHHTGIESFSCFVLVLLALALSLSLSFGLALALVFVLVFASVLVFALTLRLCEKLYMRADVNISVQYVSSSVSFSSKSGAIFSNLISWVLLLLLLLLLLLMLLLMSLLLLLLPLLLLLLLLVLAEDVNRTDFLLGGKSDAVHRKKDLTMDLTVDSPSISHAWCVVRICDSPDIA